MTGVPAAGSGLRALAELTGRSETGLAPVLELGPDWDSLVARSADAGPFVSRPWVEPWIETGRARGTPVAAGVWSGPLLVGLLVVCVRSVAGVRIASPPDAAHPGYHGILADPAHPGAAAAIAALCVRERLFDVLVLQDVRDGDAATAAFLAALRALGFAAASAERSRCHAAALLHPHERFLRERHSGKSAKNLRRDARRLAESGEVRVMRYFGAGVTTDVVRRAAAIQADSWLRRRGAALLGTPFHERLAVAAARSGNGCVWILTVDGADAAFGYALASHGAMHFVWTAFRLRFRDSSAGKVLLHQMIADSCDAGMRSFDFGHGDAAYKRFWSTGTCVVRRVAAGRGLRGRVAAGVLAVVWRAAQSPKIRALWRGARRIVRGEAFSWRSFADTVPYGDTSPFGAARPHGVRR